MTAWPRPAASPPTDNTEPPPSITSLAAAGGRKHFRIGSDTYRVTTIDGAPIPFRRFRPLHRFRRYAVDQWTGRGWQNVVKLGPADRIGTAPHAARRADELMRGR